MKVRREPERLAANEAGVGVKALDVGNRVQAVADLDTRIAITLIDHLREDQNRARSFDGKLILSVRPTSQEHDAGSSSD
jgi:hypothetical protein